MVMSIMAVDVHQNDIGTDFNNISVRDNDIGFIVKKGVKFIFTADYQGMDVSVALIKFQVVDPPQAFAAFNIDNVLTFQLGKQHCTSPF
jgi:hypothetical protein